MQFSQAITDILLKPLELQIYLSTSSITEQNNVLSLTKHDIGTIIYQYIYLLSQYLFVVILKECTASVKNVCVMARVIRNPLGCVRTKEMVGQEVTVDAIESGECERALGEELLDAIACR